MIAKLKQLFEDALRDVSTGDEEQAHCALQRASAALLVEMTRADRDVSDHERAAVARALVQVFGLPENEVRDLMEAAEEHADEATSLYEFTSVINEGLAHERKVELVEQLWRVAYSDGELEKHEAHLVRKVADLLHLRHKEYIGAKLRAAESMP